MFARMYFDAYDAWERGDLANVPDAWEEAFDAGRDRSVAGIGNLLMSMNAHINRDFPFMLANLGLTMPNGASRKPDHDRGNEVLNRLYDDVLQEIARRWDPTVLSYDVRGTTIDDAGIFQILQGWREQVWRHAEMLVNAPTPEERQAVADYIEGYALEMARTIKAGSSGDPTARDAHCAAYRAANRERGALARPVIRRRGLRARRGDVRVRVACPGGIRLCDGKLLLHRLRRPVARRRAITARVRKPVLLARVPLPAIEPGRAARRATRDEAPHAPCAAQGRPLQSARAGHEHHAVGPRGLELPAGAAAGSVAEDELRAPRAAGSRWCCSTTSAANGRSSSRCSTAWPSAST